MARWIVGLILVALMAVSAQATDLRIGFKSEVSSADPHVFQAFNRNVWLHVYEPLVAQDKDLKAVPGLAQEWRATDRTTWVFKLRPNVTFHDGSPFTAEDAKASIERAMAMPGARTYKPYLRDIDAVKAIDPLTLQVTTKVPSPTLPDNISLISMLPKVMAQATEQSFAAGQSNIGTGPYKFVEFSHGQRVVLAKNEKYWGNKEPWDKVTFQFIPKDPARASALLSGTVDVIDGVSANLGDILKSNKFDRTGRTSYMLNFIGLDVSRAQSPFVLDDQGKKMTTNPLSNRKVRQALMLSVNRDLIIRNIMKGDATPTAQLVPAGFFGNDPTLTPAPADPAKAKALLAEAGYPNGFRLSLHCPNDRYPNDAKVCEAVGQMFTQIGVKTDVQTLPFAVFTPKAQGSATEEPAFSAWLIGIGAVTGDSLQPLIATLASFDAKAGLGAGNWGRYSNKEVDALILKAAQSMNPAEREQLQRDATRLAAADAGTIPLHNLKAVWAYRKGLTVVARADGFTFATGIREEASK